MLNLNSCPYTAAAYFYILFLHSSLSQLVRGPKIVREIDWVNRFWPEHGADDRYVLTQATLCAMDHSPFRQTFELGIFISAQLERAS